jgi:CBS domain-containing protein
VEAGQTPVSSIMHRDFERVHLATPLSYIYRIFAQRGRSDIIVIDDDGHFLGLVTELDLLRAISPGLGVPTRRKTGCIECLVASTDRSAADIMSRTHITVPLTTTVEQAMVRMEKNRHPDVIVVDDDGIATGVVEMCDVIAFLLNSGALPAADPGPGGENPP